MTPNHTDDDITQPGAHQAPGWIFMAEYAEAVGKNKATISRLRTAAEVLKGCDTATFSGLLDKAQQLYEIHALPDACWSVMVAALVKHGWSAADKKLSLYHLTRMYR